MATLSMLPQVDTTIPNLESWLKGLKDAAMLAEQIRRYVIMYRKCEAVRNTYRGTTGEIEVLDDMADILKRARQKMLAPPTSLALDRWLKDDMPDVAANDASRVALDALDSMLADIADIRQYLDQRRPGRGNPGAPGHQDMTIAGVVALLRGAGVKGFNQKAHSILQDCGVLCPDGAAFARAAKRGMKHLQGPPKDLTLDAQRDAALGLLGL